MMEISLKTAEYLAQLICGAAPSYRSGPELVRLFNRFGFDDGYGQGFPSRFTFARSRIEALNGTKELKELIEYVLNPVNFIDREAELESAIETFNKYLVFDGYKIERQEKKTTVVMIEGDSVVIESSVLSDDFIQEQITKCRQKISSSDYDGAITNARSLVEGVIGQIYVQMSGQGLKKTGDLKQDYKKIRETLKLSADDHADDHVRQVLNGLTAVIDGIDTLSNSMGDRHRRPLKPEKRHAKLVVNAALTISDFLLDTYEKHTSGKK